MTGSVTIIVERGGGLCLRGDTRAILFATDPQVPRPFGGCGSGAWDAIREAFAAYQRWQERGGLPVMRSAQAPVEKKKRRRSA